MFLSEVKKKYITLLTQFYYEFVRGVSIYNGNTLITLPTGALEFYTLYGTKDLGFTVSKVHRIVFYLSYLFSYRLLKKGIHILVSNKNATPTK